MKILVEVDVTFDAGHGPDLEEIDESEISDEIASAVSGCAGIQDVAAVTVENLKIELRPAKTRRK